jgi:gliding motility-associated-like protein
MKQFFSIVFTLVIFNSLCYSQLVFQKNYGGASNEEANGIIAESDHTFFIVGNTVSYGLGTAEDALHMKVDAAGNIISSKTYGVSTLRERARHIKKTSDGGYLVTGDKLKTGASDDIYIQKLNSAGNQVNAFFYGDDATGDDEAFAGDEIPVLNYYIMFGFTSSYGTGGGNSNAFFKIVDNSGVHVASRYYGGSGWNDGATDGFFNAINGIFLAGRTNSIGAGGVDGLVIRTQTTAPYNITWQRAIGGTGDEEFFSMKEVPSGGIICAGFTNGLGATGEDIFICRIALNGTLTWARRIGGAGNERARAIWPTPDGGFIVAGYTTSAGAGGEDAFLLKLASNGTTEWAKVYGGSNNDRFHALAIRPSSFGYTAVGYSESFTNGGRDFYFVATDINGNTNCHQNTWNPTNTSVTPTVTTTGITVNTTGHNSINYTFITNNPTVGITCRCIEELPRIDISGPTQVCRNQTGVTYSIPAVTGVTNYNWTATNATITSATNSTSITVNFGTSNAQLIVQAVYGNCSNFDIDTINITIDPITANITGTSPICFNQSSLLTANAVNPQSGVSGYSWSNSVTTQTNSVTPPVGANTYTVTITDGLGCTATSSFTVNVNPLPTPGIISNSPVCAGQTITLQGSGGTGYSWSGPNSFSSLIQNPTVPNAQAVNAGTYTVTVTDANSCTATTTATVVVNPLPTPVAGSNSPVCIGQTINLNAGGGVSYSWSGPNSFANGTQNPSITNAQLVNAGTYTVTVTDANTCSATATTSVTVNPLPVPTIGSNSPVCVGQTINLNAGGGTSYSWSGPNSFSNGTQNPSITNAQLVNAGTYTVTVTDANTCSATATTSVTVNPLPVPTIGSNSPVCLGQTINLNAGGGTSYSWSGPNAFSNGTQNPSITNAQLVNAGTYTVTVTDANTCSATATTSVTVNPLPNPTIGSNSPVCVGQTINLNAGGGVSYSWTGPNAFTNSTQNPSISNAQVANAGTYTVTVTDANNCSATATTSVIVNTLPTPSIASNSPVCVGQTINLNGGGGVSYSWTGPNAFASVSQNPSISNAQLTHAGTYTVTVTDANSCFATATISVTVNPLPAPGITSNSPVCAGQTINLQGSGGTSYSWTGPNAFTSNIQNPTIANAQNINAGIYTVTVTDVNNCTASTTASITVNALPNPTASNNGPLCETNTLQLNASGGVSYAWIGPNGFSSALQNPTISNVTLAENGIYTVTVTGANSCTATATTTVVVSPDLVVTIGSNSPVCVGTTLNLTSMPGSSHQWTGPASFTSNIENPTINNVTLANAGTYTVTVTNAQGCSGTASVDVIVNTNPLVYLGADTTLCDTQTLLLDAGNPGASYSWNDGSANQTFLVNTAGTYTVTVTDANGCSALDNITVSYQPLPNVDLGADLILCQGASVQIGYMYSGATYSWNTGETTSFINVTAPGTYTLTVSVCNTTASDNITITADSLNVILLTTVATDCGQSNGSITVDAVNGIGTISYNWPAYPSHTSPQLSNISSGSYTVIVTDQAGCSATLTTTLGCNSPDLDIPQFISPNGDGKNDTWVIDNLTTDFPNNQLKIFNRWGNEVFVANPYLNDWDGRPNTVLSLGSNILPAGTYFFVLDLYGDSSDIRTGFIELNP